MVPEMPVPDVEEMLAVIRAAEADAADAAHAKQCTIGAIE
jgi:hypothetical protein